MPAIVVSDAVAERLRSLVRASSSHEDVALRVLRTQLDDPPQPEIKGAHFEPSGTILTHKALVDVARWAISHEYESELRLSQLLYEAQVAVPVKPKPERSPALIEALRKIELEQEEKAYAAMLPAQDAYAKNPMLDSFRHLSMNKSGRTRIPGHGPSSEEQEWLEVRQQISAIINILISMAAVAVSVWWAGGTADPIWKTLVALPLCILVAVAETVLYARYWRNINDRKEKRKHSKRDRG